MTKFIKKYLLLAIGVSVFMASGLAQTPTIHASSAVFTEVHCNTVKLSWSKGDGTGRLVVCRKNAPVNSYPQNNVFYPVTDSIITGSSTPLGSGNYIVYSDTGNQVIIKGLEKESDYYVAVFEYYTDSTIIRYLTTSGYAQADTTTENIEAEFEIADGFQCIADNLFQFTNGSSNSLNNPMTYLWDFGDKNTSTDTNPTYSYTKGGIFKVTLTANAIGCKTSIVLEDTVVVPFITDFILDPNFSGNDSVQCIVGNNFKFKSTSYPPPIAYGGGGDRTNYLYLTSEGQKRETPSAEFVFKNTGLHKVTLYTKRLVDKDTIGCIDSAVKYYRVLSEVFSPDDLDIDLLTRCKGADSTFRFSIIGDSGYTVLWQFPNNDTDTSGTVYRNFSATGNYPFSLTGNDSNGCPFSYFDTIRIIETPEFNLGNTAVIDWDSTLHLETLLGDFSYLWSTNDTTWFINLAGSDLGIGTHTIWAHVYHSSVCSYSDTLTVIVTDPSAVRELPIQTSVFTIFPNPTRGSIEIKSNQNTGIDRMEVFSTRGRHLQTVEAEGSQRIKMFINGSPGIYFLQIHGLKGETQHVRIVKH